MRIRADPDPQHCWSHVSKDQIAYRYIARYPAFQKTSNPVGISGLRQDRYWILKKSRISKCIPKSTYGQKGGGEGTSLPDEKSSKQCCLCLSGTSRTYNHTHKTYKFHLVINQSISNLDPNTFNLHPDPQFWSNLEQDPDPIQYSPTSTNYLEETTSVLFSSAI